MPRLCEIWIHHGRLFTDDDDVELGKGSIRELPEYDRSFQRVSATGSSGSSDEKQKQFDGSLLF